MANDLKERPQSPGAERKVSSLRKTIDKIFMAGGGLAAADMLVSVVPSVITGDYGDYPTIHEYFGAPSDYNELSGVIASVGAAYLLVFRKSLVGKHFWQDP